MLLNNIILEYKQSLMYNLYTDYNNRQSCSLAYMQYYKFTTYLYLDATLGILGSRC